MERTGWQRVPILPEATLASVTKEVGDAAVVVIEAEAERPGLVTMTGEVDGLHITGSREQGTGKWRVVVRIRQEGR